MGSACSQACVTDSKGGPLETPGIFRNISFGKPASKSSLFQRQSSEEAGARGGNNNNYASENNVFVNNGKATGGSFKELDKLNESLVSYSSAKDHVEMDDLLEAAEAFEGENNNNANQKNASGRRGSIEILNNSITFNMSFDLEFLKSKQFQCFDISLLIISLLDYPDHLLYEAHCAQKGNLEAQVSLAIAYDKGTRGLEVNTAEAIRWYVLAADRGNLDAQMALGALYQTGHDGRFEPSEALAFKYYKLAAENGNPIAQFKVAVLMLSEPSKLYTTSQALQYLKQSARQGYVQAEACLATLLLEGKTIEMDIRKGIRLMKSAGLKGDYVALHNLAFAYKLGLGVFQDRDMALAYAELASFKSSGKFENDLEKSPGMINYF
jgi:TPR repeat protein